MTDGCTIVVATAPQSIVVESTPPAAIVVETSPVSVSTNGTAVSTDDSFGLIPPTDIGLEFVIVANALDDIRWNGVSL